ncbi:hypothetical protein N5079_32665 [Planotetraspora sp. A-T 1434]|uniref:hypothetical protein n=1 Tax=Planotetraspora sp. A-T 1434 TaxID=2979219 RepID=UPI0021C1B9FD|nr:hypothetical protein [Planotetraspora sp. A-T 1434]MCT9934969.1 hypothetical protein [Planotetraspora sp. A-T 1434]
MTLDELLAIDNDLERLETFARLPEAERLALVAEMAERQAAFARSWNGPVYDYWPSVEEGRCMDSDEDEWGRPEVKVDRDGLDQPQMRYRNEDGLLIADPIDAASMTPQERQRFDTGPTVKRLNVIDVADGEILSTINLLPDGSLSYSDELDRGIVEAMARSNGWTTDTETFARITGWTNGYMLLHPDDAPLPWENQPGS